MLNHDIIEWEACVITIWMCLLATAAWTNLDKFHPLHELQHILLAEIMKEGLTTIFLPYAFRIGQFL